MSILRQVTIVALLAPFRRAPLRSQSYQGGIRARSATSRAARSMSPKSRSQASPPTYADPSLSNAAGEFVFNSVDPSTYRVTAARLCSAERSGVIVSTQGVHHARSQRLEIRRQISSVNVTEEVPLLETPTLPEARLSTGKAGRSSQSRPQSVHDGEDRAQHRQAGDPLQSHAGSERLVANQHRRWSDSGGNSYLLVGVPITASSNVAIIIPTIESVQEVKISRTHTTRRWATGGGCSARFSSPGRTNITAACSATCAERTGRPTPCFSITAAG